VQSHREDTSTQTIVLCTLSLIALYIIWFFTKHYFAAFYVAVAHFYGVLISFLVQYGPGEFLAKLLFPDWIVEDIDRFLFEAQAIEPVMMSDLQISDWYSIAAQMNIWLVVLVNTILIIVTYKRAAPSRLKTKHNIITLANQCKSFIPELKPVLEQNLLESDPDKGPFRREESPIRFAIKHGLIYVHEEEYGGVLSHKKNLATFSRAKGLLPGHIFVRDHYTKGLMAIHRKCYLDREKTKALLTRQLGKPFTSYKDMSPYRRALMAVFLRFSLGGDDNKQKAWDLLDQFNNSWESASKYKTRSWFAKKRELQIDMTGVDETIEFCLTDPEILFEHPHISETFSKHAFETTLLTGLLIHSKKMGKLNTPKYLWFKALDRVMFYSLNQVGGQCGWSEAAGPFAHLLVEDAVEWAVNTPNIDHAVDGLEEFLNDTEGWIPLDPPKEPKDQVNKNV